MIRVAVIGDLMLDVLVEPDGPLRPGDDTPGRIRMESGGQAANVAAWVAALGGRARLVCARSGDDGGTRAASRLSERGVEVVGPVLEGGGGVVVSMISATGERTLVSDPGCTRALRPEHLAGAWFAGCDWLHVSGYHLFDDDAAAAAMHAASLAHAGGARISLDLACAARLRALDVSEVVRRVHGLGADLVFQTAEEADAIGGAQLAAVCAIKRGPDGCTVVSDGERMSLPAAAAGVVDTTGAGDAFAAGFLLGGDLRSAALSGLSAAARCVAAVGAMPRMDPVAPAVAGA